MFVSAMVWLVAGGMLFYRGFLLTSTLPGNVLRLVIVAGGGGLFYFLMFTRLVSKHIARIAGMRIYRPCLFSFFRWRSYLLMSGMIVAGIVLRKTELFPDLYTGTFYMVMGFPLLLSSVRFLLAGINFRKTLNLYPHSTIGQQKPDTVAGQADAERAR